MSPIDPIRRAARLSRAARAQAEDADAAAAAADTGLPVPVGAPRAAPPPEPPMGAGAFDAHLIGQQGEKRGLRAGPQAIDSAARSYNRTEWSGAKDRRARKGAITRTEI
jgi:hypothetical protein